MMPIALVFAALVAAAEPLPTPIPLPTIPPAIQKLPGVDAGVARPGIPVTVTLDQAIAIGIATAPSLQQARADASLAAVQVNIAREPILPNLSGGGSTVRIYASPGPNGVRSLTNNSAALELSQLIFDGGRVAAEIQAASKAQVSAVDAYRFAMMAVARDVANAYYAAVAAHRTTQLDAELVTQSEENEKLVRAQIRSGVEAGADLAQAEYQTAASLRNEVVAQGNELSALANLDLQMGLDSNTRVIPGDSEVAMQHSILSSTGLPSYDKALARAYAFRADYDAAVATLDSARRSLVAARRAAAPVLVADGSYGTLSTDPGGGTFRENGAVGLTLSLPLFDQGATQAGIAQARATIAYDEASLSSSAASVSNGVKNALINVITARASVKAAEYEVSSAKVSLAVARGQYRAGVTTLPLLVQANTSVTQAYTDETTSLETLRQAEVALLFAMGDELLLRPR